MSEAIHQAENEGYALSPEQRVVLADPLLQRHPAVFLATLNGAWREDRLARAWERVRARHEILQTAFRQTPGYASPRQYPLEGEAARLETRDARHVAPAEWAALERAATRLESGRHVRCVLLRGEADRWRLALSASRLVADEAGLASLYRDVLRHYGELLRDEGAFDSALDGQQEDDVIQYPQFVEWREELARGEEAPEGAAYWTRYLERMAADGAEIPSLPYARTAGTTQTAASPRAAATNGAQPDGAQPDALERTAAANPQTGSIATRLDGALVERTARACGVAPAVLAQAAWWALLARIGGHERILGAWQHDCRDGVEMLEGSIGAFVRTYPVVLACPPQRKLADIAAEVGALLDAHTRWQEYWPADPRTLYPSFEPFDQVGFAVVGMIGEQEFVEGARRLHARADDIDVLLPGYELALQVGTDAAGAPCDATLHFRTGRYAQDDMKVLLEQYETLLSSLDAETEGELGELVRDGAQRQSQWLAWQGVQRDWAQPGVLAGIEAWARKTPDAPALRAPDLTLTYAELDARVAVASARLRERGVGRGSVVGLLLPRSGALVVALLATLRAGAAYLPLDPAWPPARREEILAQARADLVLYAHGMDLPDAGPRPPAYVVFEALLDGRDATAPAPVVSDQEETAPGLDDDAYILFTSGSTGKPKGVVIGHRQLLNYVAGSGEALGFDACRRFGLTSTVAADLGNTTLFGALYHGACLVVARAEDMNDAQSFAAFLTRNEIDCLKITPSHLGALLDAADVVVPDVVVLGGEPVPASLAEKIHRLAPRARLFNHYGPTETTVGVLVHEYRPSGAQAAGSANLSLTVPLPNCYAYVLDEARRLAPTGMKGELYLGGAQLSRGYLEQAGADAFVDDPLRPGQRLYRSGDRARYLSQGGIQLVGRADAQLKIRGFRIEPAEIEAELLRLDGVREAAVRAWGEDSARQLAAYVVCSEADRDGASLRAALSHRLPEVMVPSSFTVLSQLPRLENGKIDRRALPDPRGERAASAIQPPRTALEGLLLNLVAALLEKEPGGIDASFFDAGMESLAAIRLASRIRELLRIEVLPGLVFSNPTVRKLSAALSDAQPDPQAFERLAALRLKLETMSPEARERLLQLAEQKGKPAAADHG